VTTLNAVDSLYLKPRSKPTHWWFLVVVTIKNAYNDKTLIILKLGKKRARCKTLSEICCRYVSNAIKRYTRPIVELFDLG
jgi:hypothetical protein